MDKSNILEDLMPDDALIPGMWYSCIHWALGKPEFIEAFQKDTGNNYRPPKSAIEKMVDEATGADKDFIREFAKWVNKNIWGEVSNSNSSAEGKE